MTDEIKPPLSLTESGIEFERDGGGHIIPDNALQAARTELSQARIMSEQLAEAINATAADPSMAPSQRALRSKKLSDTVAESIGRKLDAARNALTTELQRIETSADWNPRPATTARDIVLESDVRAVLRAMTATERLEALNSAVRNNDTAILAAAFSGPSLLIAMPDEQRTALLQHWRKQHVKAWSRHERLMKASARINQAGIATVSWMKQLSAATDLQELADRAETARQAAEDAAKKVA